MSQSQSQRFLRPPPSSPRGWNLPHLPPQPPSQYGMTMASHPGSTNPWNWGSVPHHPPTLSGEMNMPYYQDAQPTRLTSHPATQTLSPGGGGSNGAWGSQVDATPEYLQVDTLSEYQRGLADGRLLANLDRLESDVLILRKSLERARSSAGSGVLAGRLPLVGLAAGTAMEDLWRRDPGTAYNSTGSAEQPWVRAVTTQDTAPPDQTAALYDAAFHCPAKDPSPPRVPVISYLHPSNNMYRLQHGTLHGTQHGTQHGTHHGTTSSSFAHTSQPPDVTFQPVPSRYPETRPVEHVTSAVKRHERGPEPTFASPPTVRRSQGGRTGGRGRTHDLLREIQARSETIVITLESDPRVKTDETRTMLLHLVPSLRKSLTAFIERCIGDDEQEHYHLDQSVIDLFARSRGEGITPFKSWMTERLSGLFKSSRGPSWKLTKNALRPRVWSTLRSVTEFEHEMLRQLQRPEPDAPRVNDEDDAHANSTRTCNNPGPGSSQDDSASLRELSRSQTLCDAGWTPGKSGGEMLDEWIESDMEDDKSEGDDIDCRCEECFEIPPLSGLADPGFPVGIGGSLDTDSGGVDGTDPTDKRFETWDTEPVIEGSSRSRAAAPWAPTWSWNEQDGCEAGDCTSTVPHDTDRKAGEPHTIDQRPYRRINPGQETVATLLRKTRSAVSLVEAGSQVFRPRSCSDGQGSVPPWCESCGVACESDPDR
jgi:hypothetical protein